ncbi:hypothetical protein PA598K_01477 [Paenibacillus sp. 598K]|uniref:YolD-like family protein n=1 Tax=Paenibacillus sp. 598K TaxID=1117987 RepID=UPI000FFA8943|nr:YolD-like family protein [Paenibacillus sp. 598K]GBF73192.1 hypothetical protein PA598K_01477 [Paenibacillus sp. 598K]
MKKLEGNGLWESSRMILPEHRVQMQQRRQLLKRRDRPQLDEQAIEQIQQRLADSLEHKTPVTVTVYHPYEPRHITGHVESVNVHRRRILVDGYWIGMEDIEDVTS